jgi:cysteine desulfurase
VDVAAALAIATALEVCSASRPDASTRAASLSALLRSALESAGALLTGADPRLPNFATGIFPGRRGEDILLALDLAGVAASSGSACASGSLDPSHVLLAAGYSLDDALASLRLTVSYETTEAEVDRAVDALSRMVVPAHA